MASSTMALARALTRRAKRSITEPISPKRSQTVKATSGINRDLISLPTELLSTTNVHALTAPDIRKFSSDSSDISGSESDFSSIDKSFLREPLTDASSVESSPIGTPATDDRVFFDVMGLDAPAIPQRAPSHSKKAHVELSRKRSIQRMSPPPTTLTKPAVRSSADVFMAEPNHPFGRELAQVHEVAEEFGAVSAMMDEDEQDMRSKGLCKFGVADYLDEIAGLYGGVFEDQLGALARPWI